MIKINKSNPLLMSLKPVFRQLCQYSTQSGRRPSHATVIQREQIIVQEMKTLHRAGYKLKDINNIGEKHVDCLLKDWYQRDYQLTTIKKRIAIFSLVFKVLGKAGLQVTSLRNNPIPEKIYQQHDLKNQLEVLSTEQYQKQINLMRQESEKMAAHAELMLLFGLTKQESLSINPVLSHRKHHLIITIGVSRGKTRNIKIQTEKQKDLIITACKLVDNQSKTIKPKYLHEKQWINKFDFLCKKYDIKPSYLTIAHNRENYNGQI